MKLEVTFLSNVKKQFITILKLENSNKLRIGLWLFCLLAFASLPFSILAQTVYTWTGSTSSDYQTAGNWSPSRSSINVKDILQFNGNATLTNIPTQSIARLVLTNNASVSLQAATGGSSTITVGNATVHVNGTDDISIPIGSTLTLATNASNATGETLTIGLANVTGVTSNIAGTLTISPNCNIPNGSVVAYSYNTAYTVGQMVSNNGNVYTVSTAGTSVSSGNGPVATSYSTSEGPSSPQLTFGYLGTLNGSNYSTFNNVYDARYGVTNVTGTVNYGGLFKNISATNLIFSSNSTINNNRGDASFPTAFVGTYTNVNVNINNPVFTTINSTTLIYNFPASVNNFTLNAPNLVIGALRLVSISGGSTTTTPSVVNMNVIAGTFIFASTFSTFNISGNLNVTGGNFYIGNLSSQVVTVSGDLNLSNGILGMLNYITTSYSASLSVNNFNQTGGTFNLNLYNGTAGAGGTSTFYVAGNFNKSNGIFTQILADSGIIVMNGTASQTFNIGSSGYLNNVTTLQINNIGTTGNNTVTLNNSVTNITNIQLTNGLLVLGANNISSNSVIGGSSSTYIDASGTGRLTLNTVSSSATTFPVGASGSYLPITFTSTTNQPSITIGINTAFTHTHTCNRCECSKCTMVDYSKFCL